MLQQQHIQAIMKNGVIDFKLRISFVVVCLFVESVRFILFVFNLFISAFHRSRSWHLFSNFVLPKLLVGCQWVCEPILSPLLNKLIHTRVGNNLMQM